MGIDCYYDREGTAISFDDWSRLMSNFDYRKIMRTTLPCGKVVSTVWLGIDYSFGGGNKVVFETMVFEGDEEFSDVDCERSTTLDEAKCCHEEMCVKWCNDDR